MTVNSKERQADTILFVHYGDEGIRGSERCLLDLLNHLDRQQFRPIVWCNSRLFADTLRQLAIPVIRSDFPLLLGWRAPRFDLLAFAALVRQGIRLVHNWRVKLLHANSGAPCQWLNLVARYCRLPLVAHLHARYPLRDRLSLGLHQVSVVVGVSQAVVEPLHRDGLALARSQVIANGIDIDRLDSEPRAELRRQLSLEKDDILLASVGALVHGKGMDLLIAAVRRLRDQGLPLYMAIVGEGPEQPQLAWQIEQWGLQHQVHLLGRQSEVAGLLRGGVDIFVSGARDEAFGLALAEAGLAGLPVVAPAVGGIPEVIADGQTGRLYAPGSVDALCQALSPLLQSPAYRLQLGQAGRQRVLRRFGISRHVAGFAALYRQLLDTPASHLRWRSHWCLGAPLLNGIQRVTNLAMSRWRGRNRPEPHTSKFILSPHTPRSHCNGKFIPIIGARPHCLCRRFQSRHRLYARTVTPRAL